MDDAFQQVYGSPARGILMANTKDLHRIPREAAVKGLMHRSYLLDAVKVITDKSQRLAAAIDKQIGNVCRVCMGIINNTQKRTIYYIGNIGRQCIGSNTRIPAMHNI